MPQSFLLADMESNSSALPCDCLAHRFGNAADGPERVRCYGSDMTDAEWQVVRELLPVPAWLEGRGGRPEGYCHRVMLDAVRYVVDNGVKWANPPRDFPPYRRVHAFARRRQVTGLLAEFHDRLRDEVRRREDRGADPTATIVDSQSVRAAANIPRSTRRFWGLAPPGTSTAHPRPSPELLPGPTPRPPADTADPSGRRPTPLPLRCVGNPAPGRTPSHPRSGAAPPIPLPPSALLPERGARSVPPSP